MKIAFCQATYKDDLDNTIECINRVGPYVNEIIIVYDQSLSQGDIQWLMKEAQKGTTQIHTVYHEFKDNLPEMRNAYLERAKELSVDWICVSDPDELYSKDLCKNLRSLIEQNDTLGYNLLPVHAKDQFDNVEWLDELDLLKESPGGYRETDFWKPMLIFKLYPDTTYEGVGKEKNVHEMLRTSVGWNSTNLPKQYFYVHKKSALKIWRNAARNMFIGGGGDNVGKMNPLWEQLRDILSKINVFTWNDFEKFVTEGRTNPTFTYWVKKALKAPPTNWGTETRELAKWYLIHNKETIDEETQHWLDNPPKITKEMEISNLVTRSYFQILGRHPDEKGLQVYSNLLLSGRMTEEDLVFELMNSEEYRLRQGMRSGPIEVVPIKVPVNISVNITEQVFIEALMRSETYWNIVKPKIDIGSKLLAPLSPMKQKEFLGMTYNPINKLETPALVAWLLVNYPKADSIGLCIMGFSKGLPLIIESLKICSDYVDEIHIQGDDFTDGDIELILDTVSDNTKNEVIVQIHLEEWKDDFSEYKNLAISRGNTEWVLILDHDEIPSQAMVKNLKDIVKKSNHGKQYNIVQFDVLDQKVNVKGKTIEENLSSGGKPLFHWNVAVPYHGNPHIWLKPNYYPWKHAKAPYAYRHVKEIGSELPRSVRNVFLGGGGDNSKGKNPVWIQLRKVCDNLGLHNWNQFNEYLIAGKIDSLLLMVFEDLSVHPWKDDELKDPLRYYQELHSEEFEGDKKDV